VEPLKGWRDEKVFSLFNFANSNIENIIFLYISADAISENGEQLQLRFDNARTLPGTQSFHKFKPCDSTTIEAYELSSSDGAKKFVIIKEKVQDNVVDFHLIMVNSVVACFNEESGEWFLATVIEKNGETMDLNVNFFHPSGPQSEIQRLKKSKKNDTRMQVKNVIQIVTNYSSQPDF
jgi:hypothetical protein